MFDIFATKKVTISLPVSIKQSVLRHCDNLYV